MEKKERERESFVSKVRNSRAVGEIIRLSFQQRSVVEKMARSGLSRVSRSLP